MVIDAAIVLIIVAGVIAIVVARTVRAVKVPKAPVELARAARLLDRVRATDDAVTNLPRSLRDEIDAFLLAYYKEINE